MQTLLVLLGLEIAKHNLFNTLEVCVKVDTTIYHAMEGYAVSAIATESKMKLTFY